MHRGNPAGYAQEAKAKLERNGAHEVIHYIRNGRTCIASMGRFQHEFEPLTKAQAERIAEEIETAEHLKKLRAQRAA
ncbi:TPA: DUF4222 domain-containing protein [Enterobacter asburiae]|uniref:DUF4222 domain-containing protein n=1 Tax=Enterobacter asburiae TaxID=61645 RepID=UPI00157B0271|nr:DUF4222 domain-containing protein [Enterobacter asburiae]HDV8455423.1 DUF4222 domain-containing protein [Enterobacter asburiae]